MAARPQSVADVCRAHTRLALDSNVFIYLFEGSGHEADRAAELADAIGAGLVEGSLSALGLAEILAEPARQGAAQLLERYEAELTSFEHLTLAPVDVVVARDAALLRVTGELSLADAIHLASARRVGATAFVTNDRRIRGINDLDVVYLGELAPGA
ncbi:MAG: type II toxin-antitoxin system VapC family toxin [Candidatus Limnocylindrales bacterium]